jgi:hypothetical protein
MIFDQRYEKGMMEGWSEDDGWNEQEIETPDWDEDAYYEPL